MVKINRLKFKAATLFVVLAAILCAPALQFVNAATPSLAVASTVSLRSDGGIGVKHNFVFTDNAADVPAEVTLAALGSEIKGLSVKAQEGTALSSSLSEDNRYIAIAIPVARQKFTGNWSFSVEYTSQGLSDFGQAKFIQLPSLAANLPVTSQSLRLAADLSLGFASVRGPAPVKTNVGIGQQLLDFADTDSQIDRSIGVVFGESTRALITVKTTLKNNSWWWKDVVLTLPPDTNQQTVRLDSIEPKPSNVRLDRDGNILAVYRLGPLGQKEVSAVVDANIRTLTYKLDNNGAIKDTDALLVERYTKLTDNWQPLGLELDINGDKAANEAVRTVFDAVVEKTRADADIDQVLTLNDRTAPLKYADWLVGELRSRMIPARVVIGLVFTDGERVIAQPRTSAWAEVYVNGTGWITLDPWLAAHSGLYGAADPLHVALGLWGLEDDRPPVAIDSASVSFISEEPPAASEPTRSLSAKKHVILPFLSVVQVSVNHGEGTIVDDIAVEIGGRRHTLGSIAPVGTVTSRQPSLGLKAFKSEQVKVGTLNGEDFNTWAEVKADVSYLPLLTLVSIVILVILGRWLWRRRGGSGHKRFHASKESLTLHDEATGGDVESENLIQPPAIPVESPPQPNRPPRRVQ